jgi:hypothetical protein
MLVIEHAYQVFWYELNKLITPEWRLSRIGPDSVEWTAEFGIYCTLMVNKTRWVLSGMDPYVIETGLIAPDDTARSIADALECYTEMV